MALKSRGQRLLLELTAGHGAGRRIATQIGVKENQISQWRGGDIKPDAKNRSRFEPLGIPSNAWDEPDDEAPADESAKRPSQEPAA